MKVVSVNVNNGIQLQNRNGTNNLNNKISFRNFIKAIQIERSLKKNYNINCDFGMNSFVAECTLQVVKLFDTLFGHHSLPGTVGFLSLGKKYGENNTVLGMHVVSRNDENSVYFNSDCKCFKTKNKLKFNEMTEKLLWWHPTGHYLQTFVHEFGHSAHYENLRGKSNSDVMIALKDTKIPTAVGRLIAKFKLGRYSATNMNEFMAERITKDLCKNLNSQDMFIGNRMDIDYANIFSNKWKYRYSSPQAYLDYYTQQVWNGDIEEAENAAGQIEMFLKEIDAKEVISAEQPVKENVPKKSFWAQLAEGFYNLNKNITNELDEQNRLRVRKW